LSSQLLQIGSTYLAKIEFYLTYLSCYLQRQEKKKKTKEEKSIIMRCFFTLILSLLPLAFGQTPFPIAFNTKSLNAAQSSSGSSLILGYISSLEAQPAYTSFAEFMSTATAVGPDASAAFSSVGNDPFLLAVDFLAATATPAWYTEIPSPLQSYVNSIANADASIISKVVGGGAERVEAKVAVMGSLLAAMFVGMLLL
jgi:hypothetical protein